MAELEKPDQRFQQDSFSGWKPAAWISLGLVAWALLLAISSWFNASASWSRSLLIIAPAIGFVAFWFCLLFFRRNTVR